ncbi:MAG TPA: SPOR domain-containing protein [Rhizomicrobium sp.]|jgi:cell division protein FtsN|nr:SPOR domain-containing protein [Rhizomicrobium sp.]
MANYERGSDDVRVFDGAEDEEDVEGSRLPLLIVIALFVLAAFGAVVWLAYQRGVQQGHAEVPRVIAAEPGPAKVAPTNAGGTPTPYTGLKIYQQPAPSDEEANADTTPPPSETPAAKPAPMTVAPPPAATPLAKPTPPPVAVVAAKPPVVAPPTPKPAPVEAKPAPVAVAPPPPVVKPAPAVVKPPVVTPAATPVAAGGSLLQIGAYKSEADANAAWRDYKAKHPAAAGLSTDIKQVDLGAKGTWYRLRIVAGSKSDAASLCDKLKADGAACIPTK